MMVLDEIEAIDFPDHLYHQTVDHARRKLQRRYRAGEEQAPKAYGLLGGRVVGAAGELTHACALMHNLRDGDHLKADIDEILDEVAIASETPNAGRAWVSDPREVLAFERTLDAAGSVLFGGYHMHRVPWERDPLRDSCTLVDTRLTEGSGLWVFILSMVDPDRPRLRAFYEGDNDREALIRLGDDR